RLGAFEKNTLQANIGQLQITSENLTSAESVIRDTDFATETSELTRSQILVQAGNSVLAIANAQSQNVLKLLGQ
ncbi:MAG: flagellin, partial [Planctomycetes bacterium]|nr:flagellin [Planctomycetota bacterium]